MKRLISVMLAVVLVMSVAFVSTPDTYAAAPQGIAGRIAIVMDFDTGEILYERNAHQVWIPASMTKSLTAFITYEEIEAGNLSLDTMVRISPFASRIASGGYGVQGNHVAMRAGSYVSVEYLLRLVMLPSSNGASVALAEHISGYEAAFVRRMNETAERLGMHAGFVNSHGATINHTTAYSIAILTREFIERFPDMLRITNMPYVVFEGRRQNNTNLLARPDTDFFRPTVDGFKTGILRESGWGHSVTELRDGRRIIAVVMNSTDNNGRHRDSARLLDFGFEEAARRDAVRAAEERRMIDVYFNEVKMEFDVRARIIDNRAMVPMRAIFEALGFDVEWDSTTRTILATTEDRTINLQIGSTSMYISVYERQEIDETNGDGDEALIATVERIDSVIELDVAPVIIDGRTFVQVRTIAESVGAIVEWDAVARAVLIEFDPEADVDDEEEDENGDDENGDDENGDEENGDDEEDDESDE